MEAHAPDDEALAAVSEIRTTAYGLDSPATSPASYTHQVRLVSPEQSPSKGARVGKLRNMKGLALNVASNSNTPVPLMTPTERPVGDAEPREAATPASVPTIAIDHAHSARGSPRPPRPELPMLCIPTAIHDVSRAPPTDDSAFRSAHTHDASSIGPHVYESAYYSPQSSRDTRNDAGFGRSNPSPVDINSLHMELEPLSLRPGSRTDLRQFARDNELAKHAYPDGPVEVDTNVWLSGEPDVEYLAANKYDIIINVAREVEPPEGFVYKGAYKASAETPDPADAINFSRRRRRRRQSLTQDLTKFSTVRYYESQGGQVQYVHVPWDHNAAMSQALPALTRYIWQKARLEHERILIHCQCGVSRSASLIIAYVIATQNTTVDQAYNMVKDKSPWIGPNMSLIYQLAEWASNVRWTQGDGGNNGDDRRKTYCASDALGTERQPQEDSLHAALESVPLAKAHSEHMPSGLPDRAAATASAARLRPVYVSRALSQDRVMFSARRVQ